MLIARDRASFQGSTWDDKWLEVPVSHIPGEITVPYKAKAQIYEEVWMAPRVDEVNAEVSSEDEDDEMHLTSLGVADGGKSPEKADSGDSKRKRDHRESRKHHKRGKSKSNKSGKRKHDWTRRHRRSPRKPWEERLATHPFKACSAITLPGDIQVYDGDLPEPLYSND